jgi:hypothetical protein
LASKIRELCKNLSLDWRIECNEHFQRLKARRATTIRKMMQSFGLDYSLVSLRLDNHGSYNAPERARDFSGEKIPARAILQHQKKPQQRK